MAYKIRTGFRTVVQVVQRNVYPRSFSVSSQPCLLYKSPFPDLDMKQQSLPQFLFNQLDLHGKRTALVDKESGESYTFNQVKEYAMKVASATRKLGYKKGDVIAIHATNCAKYAILLLALPAAGVTITTSNSAFTPGELARNLKISGATGIFASSSLLPIVQDAMKSDESISRNIKEIISIENFADYKSVEALMQDDGSAFPDDLEIDPINDILVLPFSSGTTGLPKAVMNNHQSIVTNLQQMRFMMETTAEDTFICVMPFFHVYGMLVMVYGTFHNGNKLIIVPRFEPELFLQSIQDHKVSVLHMVPPMAVFLAKHPAVTNFDLSNVRVSICGAAPLGEAVSETLMDRLKSPVIQGFGMTECLVTHGDTDPVTIGTVGYPYPNTQCKIVNTESGLLARNVGDIGEICVKTPTIMKGYLNNPEATKNVIRDGWLHTGDVGYVREDGKFVITDRIKDFIKYKAFQISPAELEDLLLKHTKVQDAAVIGIPDDVAGEVPRAYIVPKPNCQIHQHEIHNFVKEHVSDLKLLRGGIEFISEIPKSPSGKILRRILRDQYLKNC